MAHFTLKCTCGRTLKIPPELAGGVARCGGCGTRLNVPVREYSGTEMGALCEVLDDDRNGDREGATEYDYSTVPSGCSHSDDTRRRNGNLRPPSGNIYAKENRMEDGRSQGASSRSSQTGKVRLFTGVVVVLAVLSVLAIWSYDLLPVESPSGGSGAPNSGDPPDDFHRPGAAPAAAEMQAEAIETVEAEPLPKPIMSLCKAAEKGMLAQVQSHLFWGCDINDVDEQGRSPLFWAAANGHLDILRLLLSKGAEPNAERVGEDSPLCAAVDSGNLEATRLLLQAGALISKCGHSSPLGIAVDRRNVTAVQLLIPYLSGAGAEGTTLRSSAACQAINQKEPVLLDAVLGGTEDPSSAIGLVCNFDHAMGLAVKTGKEEMIGVLLRHGASATDGVFSAIESNQNELLKVLLSHGADPNATARTMLGTEVSPLSWAATKNNEEAALLILAAGARPQGLGTLMCSAIEKANWKMAAALLEYGPEGLNTKCYGNDQCKGALHWYEDGDAIACFIYAGRANLVVDARTARVPFTGAHLLAAVEKAEGALIERIVKELNVTGEEDWFASCLETVVRGNRLSSLEALHKAGVVNGQTTYRRGRPFLHLAVGVGKADIVEWLVKHGADPNAKYCCKSTDSDCIERKCQSSKQLARSLRREGMYGDWDEILALLN